jgi:hypothetical protein
MGELSNAMKVMGHLPSNVLNECPNGKWAFVGSVDVRLSYIGTDGHNPITDSELDTIRRCGPGFCKTVKGLSWPTRQDAIDYAHSLGLQVTE